MSKQFIVSIILLNVAVAVTAVRPAVITALVVIIAVIQHALYFETRDHPIKSRHSKWVYPGFIDFCDLLRIKIVLFFRINFVKVEVIFTSTNFSSIEICAIQVALTLWKSFFEGDINFSSTHAKVTTLNSIVFVVSWWG